MIRVEAPSRLHFGLFSLPGAAGQPTHWPDRDGQLSLPARHFGGVGLMVDRPGIRLTATPAEAWSAEGPGAERALRIAQQLSDTTPHHIALEQCPPEHAGLGTGTQLGLTVAVALDRTRAVPIPKLAELVGRGRRSALGVHGFAHGGFLVEGGKRGDELAPLLCRHDFPEDWRVLLMVPTGLQGIHGSVEMRAFASLAGRAADLGRTEALSRLVLLGMLPAVVTRDLEGFGEALYDFNRRVGEMFAPWQGGLYAHPRVAEIVAALRNAGVRGVGQSSWGPAVFAIVTAEQATPLADWLQRRLDIEPIIANASSGVVITSS